MHVTTGLLRCPYRNRLRLVSWRRIADGQTVRCFRVRMHAERQANFASFQRNELFSDLGHHLMDQFPGAVGFLHENLYRLVFHVCNKALAQAVEFADTLECRHSRTFQPVTQALNRVAVTVDKQRYYRTHFFALTYLQSLAGLETVDIMQTVGFGQSVGRRCISAGNPAQGIAELDNMDDINIGHWIGTHERISSLPSLFQDSSVASQPLVPIQASTSCACRANIREALPASSSVPEVRMLPVWSVTR